MAAFYRVRIDHEGGEINAEGTYSSKALARQAVVNWVEDSPISPVGAILDATGEACPEDWYLEPTAYAVATGQLSANGFAWSIQPVNVAPSPVDAPLE